MLTFMCRVEELSHLTNEYKKHPLRFEALEDELLKSLPYKNREQTKIILDIMFDNVIDYCSYYSKNYYKAEFSDCFNFVIRCLGIK